MLRCASTFYCHVCLEVCSEFLLSFDFLVFDIVGSDSNPTCCLSQCIKHTVVTPHTPQLTSPRLFETVTVAGGDH